MADLSRWLKSLMKDGKFHPNHTRDSFWEKRVEEKTEIEVRTARLENPSWVERMYAAARGVDATPKCYCGNSCRFEHHLHDYQTYCSRVCANRHDADQRAKRTQPVITGDEIEPIDTIRQWLKEHPITPAMGKPDWWVKHSWQHVYVSIQHHTAFLTPATMVERVFSILNHLTTRPRCSCGTDLKFQNGKYRQYCSNTCARSSVEGQEARRVWRNSLTDTEKEEIHRKRMDTYQRTLEEKYNGRPVKQFHIPPDVLHRIDNKDWLFSEHVTHQKTFAQIADELGISPSFVETSAKKHGIETQHYRGYQQQVIASWIQSLGEQVEVNNRKVLGGIELDIWLPEKSIAIEFNGIYWHSFNRTETTEERRYHLRKTEIAEQNGIRLFHIFETEWNKTPEIWKSIILHSLQRTPRRIAARQCEVRPVPFDEYVVFSEMYHIQGHVPASTVFGLYHQNTLVALIALGASRFNKKYQIEILRMCTHSGVAVIGGMTKLWKHIQNTLDIQSVISYCDRRYGTGGIYHQLGLHFSHNTKPDYFYWKVNSNEISHRFHFQKHRLPTLLEHFDPALTEAENMFANGYRRIWDCGHKVFVQA